MKNSVWGRDGIGRARCDGKNKPRIDAVLQSTPPPASATNVSRSAFVDSAVLTNSNHAAHDSYGAPCARCYWYSQPCEGSSAPRHCRSSRHTHSTLHTPQRKRTCITASHLNDSRTTSSVGRNPESIFKSCCSGAADMPDADFARE